MVFFTPMYTGNENIGLECFRFPDVQCHRLFVNVIHNVGRSCFETVCTIRIVEKYDAETVFFYHERISLFACFSIGVCTCIWDAEGVEHENGSFQTFFTPIQTMVVGCYQYVETRFTDGGKIFVWCTESRIATIWFSAEGYFQIGDGNIRPADFFFDEFETIGVIVSGRSTGGIDLSLVLHQVTGKKECDAVGKKAVIRIGYDRI